jgi:hypothetical protein
MLHLPVSGKAVSFSMPDGADDLAIVESRGPAVVCALTILPLLGRIVDADHKADDWATLTVTDFEYALLALRVHLAGEHISCAFDCPREACGERVEVEFRVADFLSDVRPGLPRDVEADDTRPGWFRLAGTDASFRLPTVSDQAAVFGTIDAPRRLARLCIEPGNLPARPRARVERAMESLAPEVSREITGTCPACGDSLSGTLYVPLLVIDELRRAAADVYDDVHLIAGTYHWPESQILALPRARRQAYAEQIRRGGRARA